LNNRSGTIFSAERFSKKIVMFSYGFFLLFLFRDDIIKRYLHERYQPLTVGAAVFLILASVAYSSYVRRSGCGKPHEGRRLPPAVMLPLSLVFLLAPVIWGFVSPASVIGVSDGLLKNKGTFSATSAMIDPGALSKPHSSDMRVRLETPTGESGTFVYSPINIMELQMLLSGRGDAFAGERVAVQGFVYRDDGRPDGFTLVRYFIPCCIVHAVAVTMDISVAAASSPAADQWVTVYGIIRKGSPSGGDFVQTFYIEAEKIEETGVPSDPYINRSFMKKPFMF